MEESVSRFGHTPVKVEKKKFAHVVTEKMNELNDDCHLKGGLTQEICDGCVFQSFFDFIVRNAETRQQRCRVRHARSATERLTIRNSRGRQFDQLIIKKKLS